MSAVSVIFEDVEIAVYFSAIRSLGCVAAYAFRPPVDLDGIKRWLVLLYAKDGVGDHMLAERRDRNRIGQRPGRLWPPLVRKEPGEVGVGVAPALRRDLDGSVHRRPHEAVKKRIGAVG